MSANDDAEARSAAMHTLDRLVGNWSVDGPKSHGTVRYAWFEGDAFLVQTVDLADAEGETTRGVEYIGWDPESRALRSHYFGSAGEILEYTYEITGDTMSIWFGDSDSPAGFVGTFDASGDRNTGAWHWPGGGYESNMTRIEEDSAP